MDLEAGRLSCPDYSFYKLVARVSGCTYPGSAGEDCSKFRLWILAVFLPAAGHFSPFQTELLTGHPGLGS